MDTKRARRMLADEIDIPAPVWISHRVRAVVRDYNAANVVLHKLYAQMDQAFLDALELGVSPAGCLYELQRHRHAVARIRAAMECCVVRFELAAEAAERDAMLREELG